MKRKTTKKPKATDKWFIKIRGSYLPNNTWGWLTYIPYSGFLLTTLMYVFYQEMSLAQALFVLFPNWVAAFAVMNWIAARRS